MNEYDQDKIMELGVTTAYHEEIGVGRLEPEPEPEPAWIQPSSSSYGLFGLPEMALQPSISSEVELLNDFAEKQPRQDNKGKAHDVGQQDAQSEADLSRFCQDAVMGHNYCSKGQSPDQIKRSRTAEVHNVSERRRRDKIKEKIQALQELMPHCRKKDRASILEDAANYVKSLKLQVEMMIKGQEGQLVAQYMPCVPTHSMQFSSVPQSVPIRPGMGTGVGMAYGAGFCANCSNLCAQWISVPPASAVHPFSTSALAGFPFPTMCPTPVQPTDGSCAGETEQIETATQPGRSATKEYNS